MATQGDVRAIALGLPATSERPSYGTPGFRVEDKLFARIREDGQLAVFVADVAEKEALLASEPATFFTTSHYDGYPMVLVRFDGVDEQELLELLTDSWLLRAPPKLRALLDDQ